jgi:hypothetical protein
MASKASSSSRAENFGGGGKGISHGRSIKSNDSQCFILAETGFQESGSAEAEGPPGSAVPRNMALLEETVQTLDLPFPSCETDTNMLLLKWADFP